MLRDFLTARAVANSDEYAKQYYAKQAAAVAPQVFGQYAPQANIPFSSQQGQGMGQGIYATGIKPEDKYNMFSQRMVQSGLPYYTDLAAKQLENMQRDVMKGYYDNTGTNALSGAGKIAWDIGLRPGTKEWESFIRSYAFKPSQSIVLQDDKLIPMSDYNKLKWPDGTPYVGPTLTNSQVREMGLIVGQPVTETELTRDVQIASVLDTISDLDDIVYSDSLDELLGTRGWLNLQSAGADLPSILASKAYGLYKDSFGEEPDPDAARGIALLENLSSALIYAMRGAAVGPEEEKLFKRQLPTPGQGRDAFIQSFEITKRNIRMLEERRREKRGLPPSEGKKPAKPATPAQPRGLPPGAKPFDPFSS